jgi:hypothetical protein
VAAELWKEKDTAQSGFAGMGDRFDLIMPPTKKGTNSNNSSLD